ncbi:hypothetical protein [[Limnothrix rosea] IAM M-220]|uniref:hypothetical protein n=1 Tax=[Limnothrix rosea] IAM M-220 TaxID=454133 RepID=UPI00095A12F9|nr:hypothetical protein [[Limnothrix rosea] IAM M-220]OKH12310.1 hypothetical protein NIES208_16315 [[Limnothrix rosea] IAM M-220]
MDREELLIEEWKDIRESLRYFGNKRFAQLTVFIAANGFLISNFFEQISKQNTTINNLILIRSIGSFLGLAFLVMEWRSAQYIKLFAQRGKQIEQQLEVIKLIQCRPGYKTKLRFLTGTNATYSIYLLSAIVWFLSFLLG